MPLYTIYWGSYWASSDGQALQSQVQNSLNPALYFSHISTSSSNTASRTPACPARAPSEMNNFSDPANGFSDNLTDVVNGAIDNQGLRYRRLLNEGSTWSSPPASRLTW